MTRRGGRSSLGRWSPWPGLYAAIWRLGVLLGVAGIPSGIQNGWRVSVACGLGGLVMVVGGALYHRRWRRLQSELFRRRER